MLIIKKKSLLVIRLSCTLITLVSVITLFGFFLYLNWKTENNKFIYKKSLREINAQIFSKHILLSSLFLKIGSIGRFKGKPLVEGHIKNYSSKKIVSLKLKVSVKDKEGRVLCMDSFYPLRPNAYLAVIPKKTGNYLASNDSISFTHILRNCPQDILTYLKMKTRFAKGRNSETLKLDYKIEELIIE